MGASLTPATRLFTFRRTGSTCPLSHLMAASFPVLPFSDASLQPSPPPPAAADAASRVRLDSSSPVVRDETRSYAEDFVVVAVAASDTSTSSTSCAITNMSSTERPPRSLVSPALPDLVPGSFAAAVERDCIGASCASATASSFCTSGVTLAVILLTDSTTSPTVYPTEVDEVCARVRLYVRARVRTRAARV